MRSIQSGDGVADEDRTTRARVRDTAVAVFGRDGFGATVRTIAEAAGVSPGLVIHHFGSKAGLRAECDARVLELTRETNREMVDVPRADFLTRITAEMDHIEDSGPRLVYILRSLQEGGEMARAFLEQLAADGEELMRAGVAAGTLRPSVDEAARARYVMAQSLGALLVDLVMHPPADWSDAGAILRDHLARTALPAAEVATYGLGTDPALLDVFLADHREDR